MKEQKEEQEKYTLFQNEIIRENEFLKKIKDIFNLQNMERFQDIIILQKNKYLEIVEKEVLSIFKNIFSDKIILSRKFNSLFLLGKRDFESKYNNYYEELSEWEHFINLKSDDEKKNLYYLIDFRRHCHNHKGNAIHKCGYGKKGKFIKIFVKRKSRFRKIKEIKYLICEECKKVFFKDLFINYCSNCKENYLSSYLEPNENKDLFLSTYSVPHCDYINNKIILCKLCKEKMYLSINDKILKCLKCNYCIDLNSKNELQWRCPKCNKYFKSNVKIYNESENMILTKILNKALLLKIKARPKIMNCCNIDINNITFFHKKDCDGILYFCNIENYFLNKKRAIICDKCHAINYSNVFIWTCPKCGKRTREKNIGDEDTFNSPSRNIRDKHNNINIIGDKNNSNNNKMNLKSNLYKKYLSNYIKKKTALSQIEINNKKDNLNYNCNDIESKQNEKIIDKNEYNLEKENITICNNNLPNFNFYIRSEIYKIKRNNQLNQLNENENINSDNSNNNSIISINSAIFRNSREKYINRKKKLLEEKQQNNNNNEKKRIEKAIPLPLPRSNYKRKKNVIMNSILKEKEQKNCTEYKIIKQHDDSNILNEKEEKENENFCMDYFSKKINENNNNDINVNKVNLNYNFQNKRNKPVRLLYINEKKDNNVSSNDRRILKKSIDLVETNYKLKIDDGNNEEELNNKNKKIILYSAEKDGRISKDSTTHGSYTSSLKDGNLLNTKKVDNDNGSNSREKDIFYSSSSSFNYRRRRDKNEIEIIKENEKEKESNIKNIKNNMPNPWISNRFKNYRSTSETKRIKNIYKLDNNKPDDIIEPSKIDYSKDIEVYDHKLIEDKELYQNIQNEIKSFLEKNKLPQFNIDNYTIGQKIGDGAFGILFSAINKKTKKKYAIKKLTTHDIKLLEDFHKEFVITYKINHDNILSIYGICIKIYDSTTFSLFVLMDLAECDWEIEINKRFKDKKYYTEEELIKILKQLTNALLYLQKKEIAHRDIKPENILLFNEINNETKYKICDFGEAKEKIRVNSRHKSIRGTDFYMSPILYKGLTEEKASVRDNAYKSDVFSLGYCMIIACVLDFEFINKIRNIEEQNKIDNIIKESLKNKYSTNFIDILLKMIVYSEKERIDFIGLEKLIKDKL